MRKIILTLIILASFIINLNVNASSFNTSIIGNDTFTKEITLYLEVNDLTDFSGSCNGLCGLVGVLNYNEDHLELSHIEALEEFELTQGKSVVLFKPTGVSNRTKVLKITFLNKGLKNNETSTISFENVVASDGEKDIAGANASKTIKYIEEKTTKKTTKKTTTKAKSNNANLKSITLSSGSINFNENTLSYNITVENNVESIDIKAITANNKAEVTNAGLHNLKVGENKITLSVKAEDGTTKTYTLIVTRKALNEITTPVKDKTSKENNYIIPVIAGSLAIVVVTGIIIVNKRKNK